MQTEYPRNSGYIISPLCAPDKTKATYNPIKVRRQSIFSGLFLKIKDEFFDYTRVFTKIAAKNILSVMVAVSSIMGMCNFFTLGTVIYCAGKPIACTGEEKIFYTALSAAKSYAEEYGETLEDFKPVPSVILKNRVCTSTGLMNKLLLSSSFTDGCTLYSGKTPVFNAESESLAREIVSSYISDYSMSGQVSTLPDLSYSCAIVPTRSISTAAECRSILEGDSSLRVVSVVNTLSEKKVPFETLTQTDNTLFVGESITVQEGSDGSSTLTSEIVYENGTPVSSKVLSESITVAPIARVVRVGTKTKDVLKEGLYRPLSGTVSSEFGKRWGRNHEGMDIAVPIGTPVKSAECGTVTFCGDKGTYGKLVRIDHGNGVVTAYAHLDEITVTLGQAVKANQQIALSGNTGRSTGPHLHFEVVKDGVPLNPKKYIRY